MGNCLKELKEAQKVNNDGLPQNEIKSDIKRIFAGEYWLDVDESIEPSHYAIDINDFCDNPKDWIYP